MTDMTEHHDVDTVIDAAIRDAVSTHDLGVMVTVEDAATIAGVSVRTIRRWIQHDYLPHTEDERGKRVSPADLPLARKRAKHGHDRRPAPRASGRDREHDTMETDTDAAMAAPALSSSALAQMAAIRDQWLRPLIDRIEELARENGRLEAERDALRVEFDRMRVAPEDAPRDPIPAPPRGEPGTWVWEAISEAPAKAHEGLLARLRRRLRR